MLRVLFNPNFQGPDFIDEDDPSMLYKRYICNLDIKEMFVIETKEAYMQFLKHMSEDNDHMWTMKNNLKVLRKFIIGKPIFPIRIVRMKDTDEWNYLHPIQDDEVQEPIQKKLKKSSK